MKIGVPSLEFMKLQNDSFFADLRDCIELIRQNPKLSTKTIYESKLEGIIFKRLKMSVEIQLRDRPTLNAAIELPSIDRNHIFYRALTTAFPNDVGKSIAYAGSVDARLGYVDIQKVELGGVFTRIPMPVYLNRGLFNDNMSSGEIASILLHELGHGFTFFYYLLHSALANFISAKTATEVMGASSDDQRLILIEKGMRCLGLDGVTVHDMVSLTPEQLAANIQALYINSTLSLLRSETGFGMYELRACEQLADWFASKFGAALESATAQEKLWRDGQKMMIANTARSRLSVMTAVLYGAYVVQFTIPFPKFFSEIFYDDTISKYDDDADRIKYMRQALIDELRDADLPDESRKHLVKNIEDIKVIEARVRKGQEGIGRNLAIFLKKRLIPNYRRNVTNVELQKTIEEAFYNESYVAASKFQGVAK